MKKILAQTISVMLVIANLTACDSRSPENLPGTSSTSQNMSETQSSAPGSSKSPESPENGTNSEAQKPAGEPTFLICPDGVPLYTSEITEIRSGSDKPATFAEAEQGIRGGEEKFFVRCDGFTYGYIPMPALNRVDNPDMFEEDGSSYDYIGELSGEMKDGGLRSTEFIRIKKGDKFGSLTVKNAYTIFGTNDELFGGDPEAPGACVLGKELEFDGEVELEGYICVTPTDTLYGTGGDMRFYPNAESSVKIPIADGYWNFQYGEYCHITDPRSIGYFGDHWFEVGNIHETEFDVSGVSDGDEFVKARITLENIRYAADDYGRLEFDLKNLEIL